MALDTYECPLSTAASCSFCHEKRSLVMAAAIQAGRQRVEHAVSSCAGMVMAQPKSRRPLQVLYLCDETGCLGLKTGTHVLPTSSMRYSM